jgi:hypothetical protein
MRKKITRKQMQEQINRVKRLMSPESHIYDSLTEMRKLIEMFVDYLEEKMPQD